MRINGVAINPPNGINVVSRNKLKIKAALGALNLQSSVNQVQVVNGGASSNTFTLSL